MSADIELNWQWPADRIVEKKILVKIEDIKKQGSGLFGIKKSPSLAANLPDPVIISATVVDTSNNLNGKTVQLVIPSLEIKSVQKDGFAVLGIIESKTCICIVAAESNVDLKTITCP